MVELQNELALTPAVSMNKSGAWPVSLELRLTSIPQRLERGRLLLIRSRVAGTVGYCNSGDDPNLRIVPWALPLKLR
jgi:hypothetical protein